MCDLVKEIVQIHRSFDEFYVFPTIPESENNKRLWRDIFTYLVWSGCLFQALCEERTTVSNFKNSCYISYLGTMESPPLSVVGSSSKMEEMSMPSGTGTKVYMIFSCGARRRPRNASLSASSWSKKMCSEREQMTGYKLQ